MARYCFNIRKHLRFCDYNDVIVEMNLYSVYTGNCREKPGIYIRKSLGYFQSHGNRPNCFVHDGELLC